MQALLVAVLLAAPTEVLVVPFAVPEDTHDGIKLEVARWPALLEEASKDKALRFVTKSDKARYRLTGQVKTDVKGERLVIRAEVHDARSREKVWGESYELTEFFMKVKFLDETRAKIEGGVRAKVKVK